jgi:16S rRNA G527 N7-methylase RsmG
VLVEPRRKAVAFLELAVERLALGNVEVVAGRFQDLDLSMEVVTARAFAPLSATWEAACSILRPRGRLIYFAGASFDRGEVERLSTSEIPARVEFDSAPPLVMMTRED